MSSTSASASHVAVRLSLVAAGFLIPSLQTAFAQAPATASSAWEFRVSSGSFVPTGDQRAVIKDGRMTAAQLSLLVNPAVAITGTFAWARSRDLSVAETPRLDVFTSDLGIEGRPRQWFASAPVAVSPFVGLGGGVRTLNSRGEGLATTSTAVGYASVGGEIGISRVGVRLEVRDYVSRARRGFTASSMHNDVVISAALRFNRQRATN